MFIFGRAHRDTPVLIADVESGSVGVAIARKQASAAMEVLFSERSYVSIVERQEDHHTTAVLSQLRETLSRILKQYTESPHTATLGPIQRVHVIVGLPWVKTHSSVAEESFDGEKTVTDAMIKNIAKQSLKGASPLDLSNIFESSVTRVQLNGYPTGAPVGKRAHHISVTTFQGEIRSDIKQNIENIVHEALPGRDIDFRSSTRVGMTALHEEVHTNHYMYISFGSTDTDCIAVHKEDTNDHAVVPMGSLLILHRLSGDNGLPEEALSLLRMLASDTCSAPACGALATNLAKLEPELVKLFGDTFASMAARRKIPNACFLSAQPDIAPWLVHFFERIDFAQFTVTARPLSVSLITPNRVREQVRWAATHEDSGINLAAAFVNSL